MTELRKTVYLNQDHFEAIMKGTHNSFTKRIIHLAFIGLIAEEIVTEVENEVVFNEESDTTVKERVKDLVHKGYLYEQNKEPKIGFAQALGYFNAMYKKKNPDKSIPCG